MANQIAMLILGYVQQLVSTAVVFLVLFMAIFGLVAREKSIPIISGFVRVILSFFICPFVYLKAAVLSMEKFGTDEGEEDSNSKQYLLNKIMIFMQAALVVSSIAVLAGVVTNGWGTTVELKELRDEINGLEPKVNQLKADLARLEPSVAQLNEEWKSRHDSFVGQFVLEKRAKVEQLEKANEELAEKINGVDAQTKMIFRKIEEFYARNAESQGARELERSIQGLTEYLDRFSLGEVEGGLIRTHCANWGAVKRLKLEIDNPAEKEVRAKAQPTFEAMSKELVVAKGSLPEQEQKLTAWRLEKTLKTGALVSGLIVGFLRFLLLIWLYGLLIEILWSAISVSGDLRAIRNSLSKPANP